MPFIYKPGFIIYQHHPYEEVSFYFLDTEYYLSSVTNKESPVYPCLQVVYLQNQRLCFIECFARDLKNYDQLFCFWYFKKHSYSGLKLSSKVFIQSLV